MSSHYVANNREYQKKKYHEKVKNSPEEMERIRARAREYYNKKFQHPGERAKHNLQVRDCMRRKREQQRAEAANKDMSNSNSDISTQSNISI